MKKKPWKKMTENEKKYILKTGSYYNLIGYHGVVKNYLATEKHNTKICPLSKKQLQDDLSLIKKAMRRRAIEGVLEYHALLD